MNATEKQLKCLDYHLWQNDAKWSPEISKKLKELDLGTASDVIGMFKKGEDSAAFNQLRHLGIDV
jgi:hypothetical protein|tara:strand:+ start:630 stop:824 length:195 start_codon:yes stop_codon:yes gene_type:complete